MVVVLDCINHNGSPNARVCCNGVSLLDDVLHQEQKCSIVVDLLDPIHLSIEMYGKKYSQQFETAVLIKSIMIDGFEIVPNYIHLAKYENERDSTGPTSYLGINGVWTFEIPEPFYRWRHQVTGQGWLLEPTTVSRGCVPSSSSTTTMQVRNGVGNKIPTIDPKPDEPNEPAVR